jgi:hypothetical protein
MLQTHIEIEKWLKSHYFQNYTIRPDGVVDVNQRIYLTGVKETILPVQFGITTESFIFSSAMITSLHGLPQVVHGDFDCSSTQIRSLSGIDKIMKECTGVFMCAHQATHLLGVLLIPGITKFNNGGGQSQKGNQSVYAIMNRYIGTGDILSAQDELIDAGLIDQARL